MRIGITGATGFIGRSLVDRWEPQADIVPIIRRPSKALPRARVLGDLTEEANCKDVVSDLDVLIHCAGQAHVLTREVSDAQESFRAVNSQGTRRLAEAAANAKVKRFIFLSSVSVMGEPKNSDGILRLTDPPNPSNAYGASKWEAEQKLSKIGRTSDMRIIVVRPPLVYGEGAPGNFRRLVNLIARGIPLPIGHLSALRSFVGIENLCSFLWACARSSLSCDSVFFVSDGEDISIVDLARRIGRNLEDPTYILSLPTSLVSMGAALLGKSQDLHRLSSNLRLDISSCKQDLSWAPTYSVDDQLAFLRSRE